MFLLFDFQIALLGQLSAGNSYLLKHSILLRIQGLKYNFGKQNQFGQSRCSDNQYSNFWTVFYKIKKFICSWENEFVRISRSIRH